MAFNFPLIGHIPTKQLDLVWRPRTGEPWMTDLEQSLFLIITLTHFRLGGQR